MLRFTPVILAVLWAIGMYKLSAWRMKRVMAERSTVLEDPTLFAATEQIRRALDLKALTVYIYDIAPINGFAAPDGKVYITKGFYDAFRRGDVSAEEIASVVAHELGHVALGHTQRRIIDFAGQNAIRSILTVLLARFIPFVGAWIAAMLSSLIAARLSRSDEFEADAYATALMIKAGLGAEPQKSLFAKLDHLTGAPGASTPAWLLSHPETGERIAAIERNVEKWSA